jgi:hypothetical protein
MTLVPQCAWSEADCSQFRAWRNTEQCRAWSKRKARTRDDPCAAKPEQITIQVKRAKNGVKNVLDLRGVLDREQAAIGVLISLQPPTKEMVAEAVSSVFYAPKTNARQYPKLQLRTVKELMEGKGIERPSNVVP